MALMETPQAQSGLIAPPISLADPHGRVWSLDDVRGPNGLVVGFICNHCPYVKAIAPRLAADISALKAAGIGVVFVMPNDHRAYPEDAPDRMAAFAAAHGFADTPYLIDETRSVARDYGAVCTPDFFGFDRDLRLMYRGRLDAVTPSRAPAAGDPRELVDAMRAAAEGHTAPEVQRPSLGCSIKWKTGATA